MTNNSIPNNEIGDINDIKNALKSIAPSYDFGPDEAILELIEDDIGLLTDGIVKLNYEVLKIAAKEIGVPEENLDNTIDFLITLNPKIVYSFKKRKIDSIIEIDVIRFKEFREKSSVLMKDANDDTLSNGVAKKIGAFE